MMPWDLGDGGWGVGFGWEKKSKDRREWGLANTGKGIIKLLRMSSNYFDIIRMEWEGVEKLGVEGLMSGVQGVGIGAGLRRRIRRLGTRSGLGLMKRSGSTTNGRWRFGGCGILGIFGSGKVTTSIETRLGG